MWQEGRRRVRNSPRLMENNVMRAVRVISKNGILDEPESLGTVLV